MNEFNSWIVESKKTRKKNISKLEQERNLNANKRDISFFSNLNWKEVQDEEGEGFSLSSQLDTFAENLDEDLKKEEEIEEEEKKNKFKDYDLNPFEFRIQHFSSLFSFQWPLETNENERNFCSPFERIDDEVLKATKQKNIKEFLKQRLKSKKSDLKSVKKYRHNKK